MLKKENYKLHYQLLKDGGEEENMAKHWKERKWILGKGGMWAAWGGACWIFGIIFAIVGIIGELMNTTLGLGSGSWYLLSIAAFVASIPEYIGWAVAVYLHNKEAEK